MLCRNPYVTAAGLAYGCGQCMPCRFNKRRIWSHRIMLEAAQHVDNAFVTLTYNDDNLPADGSLNPAHTRAWLNRLRGRLAPERIRFFLVGEYGDDTERPHYHAALFGYRSCAYGQSRYSRARRDCCAACDLVRDTWGKGHVYLGRLETDSAAYMAGYVTKKMTSRDDERLKGRHPEFGRMSLRPYGIGYSALWEIADALLRYELDQSLSDVPQALRHGKSELPLGRYLRGKLREMIGRDARAPQSVFDEISQELLPLRLAARASSSEPSLKQHLISAGDVKVRQQEAKRKLYQRRRTL